jgi:hypothetical protein
MFTESNTVEQMILDATAKLGGTPTLALYWSTILSEFAL